MKKNASSFWSANEETKSKSKLNLFCLELNKSKILKYKQDFNYLWKWSVRKPDIFWSKVWDFTKIKGYKGKVVLKKNKIFYKNSFFTDSRLIMLKIFCRKKMMM